MILPIKWSANLRDNWIILSVGFACPPEEKVELPQTYKLLMSCTFKFLSFLSNKLSNFVLKVNITDYTNGYRIYSNGAAKFIVKNCGKIGDGYIVLSEILIQLFYNNFKVDEIETIFVNRVRGVSNVSFSEIFLSLIGLYKIWKKTNAKYSWQKWKVWNW